MFFFVWTVEFLDKATLKLDTFLHFLIQQISNFTSSGLVHKLAKNRKWKEHWKLNFKLTIKIRLKLENYNGIS
jgi:hypothetical protein